MVSQAQEQHGQLRTTGFAWGSDFFFSNCSGLTDFLFLSLYLSSRQEEVRSVCMMFLTWLTLRQREQYEQYTVAVWSFLP